MAKKAATSAASFKAGEATLTVSDQGVSVAGGTGEPKLIGWEAVARLGGGKPAALAPLLERLDAWLARKRKRYAAGLNKGASAAALAGLEKTLGRPLPDELRQWLSWHDGQDTELIGAFKDAFRFLSAEQIAAAWRERQPEGAPGWNAAWVPLLDDDQGDLVVLDPTSPGCAVREIWRGQPHQPIVALTLAAWLEEFVEDIEAGRYHEDPERGEFSRDG